MKDTQKSAKSTTATKTFEGFTDEERAAMKERAQELKATARRGSRAGKADAESDVLAKIAEMPESDRRMAERLHAIIKASAPSLAPRSSSRCMRPLASTIRRTSTKAPCGRPPSL